MMLLLLFGTGCALPAVKTTECVPDIRVEERLVELRADLVMPQPCPEVPRGGSNEVLADWAANCASANRAANDQLTAIRKLQP